jgi:hypothetical protein
MKTRRTVEETMREDGMKAEKIIRRKAKFCAVLVAAALCLALPSAAQTGQGEWQFEVTPYVWAAGFEGTVHIGDRTASASASFSDILKNLQFATMGHYEARKGRWSIMVDPTYVSLGKAGTGPLGAVSVDGDFEQFFVGVGGSFRAYQGERGNVDILFGARYTHMAAELKFYNAIPDRRASKNQWDPYIGIRTEAKMRERWLFQFRADLAALGSGGNTSYDVTLRFDYKMTKVTSLSFGYIYLDLSYDGGIGPGRLEYDTNMAGPYLGLAFRF